MNLVWPHVDEKRQLRVVECQREWLQDVINATIHALITIGPIALVTPSVI